MERPQVENRIAEFLKSFQNMIAFAKNTMGDGGVNFNIEYQAQDSNISEYFPDFFEKNFCQ